MLTSVLRDAPIPLTSQRLMGLAGCGTLARTSLYPLIMNPDERAARWASWIERIIRDALALIRNRHVWRAYVRIMGANSAIQEPGFFHDWVTEMYVNTQLVIVRRQTVDDGQGTSLARLLGQIKKFPEVASRDRYAALFGGDGGLGRQHGEKEFDQLFGGGLEHIDPAIVTQELAQLRAATQAVNRHTSKVVAHVDEKGLPKVPTFAELNACIDVIAELGKRYYLLIKASTYLLEPRWTYEWTAIFRQPWLVDPDLDPEKETE